MSRNMNVSLEKNYVFNNLGLDFEKHCKRFLESPEAKSNKLKQFKIQCNPRGLRKGDKTVSFNGGEFWIDLFQTSYELSYTNHENSINKLYHQPLEKNEIETTANNLSHFLYNNIEQFMENSE